MPIVLNGSGPVTGVTSLNTTVSDTELGYLDGVTSAIQTQINTAGGLVKITDATFSAQSTISVDNCFSATYNNYLILLNDLVGSQGLDVAIRMRVSGSDATAANYTFQYLEVSSSTVTGSRSSSQTSSRLGSARTDAQGCDIRAYVYRPFIATETNFATGVNYDASSGATISQYVGNHSLTTSYTGFTLLCSAGNVTGNLRVYGIRN
jgi:hypothetical protein